MKVTIKAVLILFLSAYAAFAQQDTVLAKAGTQNITTQQFRERYELTPQVYPKEGNSYSKKQDLLYSIIAEKLWAQNAERLGFDTTEIMKTTFRALEDMFVRDALYKIEVTDKIKVTDKELADGLKRHFTDLELRSIKAEDSSKIFNYYVLLKKGISFDSLASLEHRKETPVEIKYGEMIKPVEDTLYDLKKNQFTAPIRSTAGWFIFELKYKKRSSYTSQDIGSALKDVERTIEDRKAIRLTEEYLKHFLTGKEVKANSNIFWSISNKISNILSERKIKYSIPDTVSVYLKSKDVLNIENELGPDTLRMTFIDFKEKPFTVQDFLRYFIFEGFFSNQVDADTVAAKLNSRVREIIQNELLAREGYRRGLENLPGVKADIQMWKDNYLAQLFKDKMIDSIHTVSGSEVYNYYQKLKDEKDPDKIEVNIIELLTDSMSVIDSVLNQVKHGADFRKLAMLHTKRKWTIPKNGEFGYFPSTMYGEIGKKAAEMKVGQMYGPLKTPNGYSLFKLIGKKDTQKPIAPFDELKGTLEKEYLGIKRSKYFINYTIGLADKYGVSIDENLLSSLKLEDFNMYTYRYMGFGGRITAVPITLPFAEWYKPWSEGKKIVP